MEVSLQHRDRCLIASPRGPLVAGGPAEDFERVVADLVRHGYPHVVVDLAAVPTADSAGVRALVRAHTTAERRGLSVRLARPTDAVRQVLTLSRLDRVLQIYDSVDGAQARSLPWRHIGLAAGAITVCGAMIWGGIAWEPLLGGLPVPTGGAPFGGAEGAFATSTPVLLRPILVVLKLVCAALIGIIVSGVHQPAGAGRASQAMLQAQVLLCVSGAMMMIIIGDSLARAFGIAGAASIIRFRTPVDDPKDVTVLFLLMGLGMAVGLGAFASAGLATLFLCAFLFGLQRAAEQRVRAMILEIEADSRTFPLAHVQAVLERNQVTYEPREVEQGDDEASVKYHALLPLDASIEDLGAQLMADGTRGVKSVSWEVPKKP